MSYVNPDYPSGKAFKDAVKAGIGHRTYNPSGMFPTPRHGDDVIEGPHFPKPHRWYVGVIVKDGVVIKVK